MLERYGCDVSVEGDLIHVSPPPTRADYLHVVDVIEDLAIARGYQTFAPSMPHDSNASRDDDEAFLLLLLRLRFKLMEPSFFFEKIG